MSRFDLSEEELSGLLTGEPAYRLSQLVSGLYKKGLEPGEITTLSAPLRERLEGLEPLRRAFAVVSESVADERTTFKWLLEAADGSRVETVLMGYEKRSTVCLSSQAGCAMGCSFCATGQLGFGRQLTSGEIVEQVVLARRRAKEEGLRPLSNVVFMGMGEPLANLEAVLAATSKMKAHLGLGARSMTVSTVGVVPGIRHLAESAPQVNLAVSLHAANDELRSRLVPLNRRYPLETLMDACESYRAVTHRRLSFEWALISGVNDSPGDARELSVLARRVQAHVNLIALNPTPGFGVPGSSVRAVGRFSAELKRRGVNVTVRDTRGQEADAACGQLAAGLSKGSLRRGLGPTEGEVALLGRPA